MVVLRRNGTLLANPTTLVLGLLLGMLAASLSSHPSSFKTPHTGELTTRDYIRRLRAVKIRSQQTYQGAWHPVDPNDISEDFEAWSRRLRPVGSKSKGGKAGTSKGGKVGMSKGGKAGKKGEKKESKKKGSSPAQSSAPSPPQSPAPSPAPSPTPRGPTVSPTPSPAASPAPSPAPSIVPESSSPPSPAPTASPEPSSSQSPTPSPEPSSPPSPPPSPAASPEPSSPPIPGPSPPPYPAPSPAPNPVPTERPAPSPGPTDACDLGLSIDCIPPFEAESCDSIPPSLVICEQRPFEMIFRYNGGDCGGSFNIQPDNLFRCTDLKDGPPTANGAVSYITAVELGGGEVYFSGFAEVGGEFTLLAEDLFAANMNVTIYESRGFTNVTDIVQPENILQTVSYHSSCSQNLFLKDRFGSFQLVVFVNEAQGTVSCFANATLIFDITVPIDIEGGAVTLTSLTVITNIDNGDGGIFDLSEQVAETIVTPASPFVATATITLDLTQRMKYTALSTVVGVLDLTERMKNTAQSTIVGVADEREGCSGTDFFTFTAGNPLPPIFPTIAPSAAPNIS